MYYFNEFFLKVTQFFLIVLYYFFVGINIVFPECLGFFFVIYIKSYKENCVIT